MRAGVGSRWLLVGRVDEATTTVSLNFELGQKLNPSTGRYVGRGYTPSPLPAAKQLYPPDSLFRGDWALRERMLEIVGFLGGKNGRRSEFEAEPDSASPLPLTMVACRAVRHSRSLDLRRFIWGGWGVCCTVVR